MTMLDRMRRHKGCLFPAVRGRGGMASEPRQALIGATVVCPCLPRFPGSTLFSRRFFTAGDPASIEVQIDLGAAVRAAAFGIVPATFIIPHFDAIPGVWKPIVFGLQRGLKKGERMIGVDEDTAIIGKLNGEWMVKGKSKVHVFARDGKVSYSDGQTLTFN